MAQAAKPDGEWVRAIAAMDQALSILDSLDQPYLAARLSEVSDMVRAMVEFRQIPDIAFGYTESSVTHPMRDTK